jgi:hypothetical protein
MEKIAHPAGRISRVLRAGLSEREIVDELCLAVLGRPAQERERSVAKQLFVEGVNERAVQDLLWALLNSYDFVFVH